MKISSVNEPRWTGASDTSAADQPPSRSLFRNATAVEARLRPIAHDDAYIRNFSDQVRMSCADTDWPTPNIRRMGASMEAVSSGQ